MTHERPHASSAPPTPSRLASCVSLVLASGAALAASSTTLARDTRAAEPAASASVPVSTLESRPEAQDLAREESGVKRQELAVRALEARKGLAAANAPWWSGSDPILLALLGAIATLLGNMALSFYNNRSSNAQLKAKAQNDLALEQKKAQYTLILQAIATNDVKVAERNIKFFIDTGLLDNSDERITRALEQFKPVLPSSRGAPLPSGPSVAMSDIAAIYNFPAGLDGSGQTIGILEFGGGFDLDELRAHFATLNVPMPRVAAVPIGASSNQPSDLTASAQVMADIQITGALAPGADVRVYFTRFTKDGWFQALEQATADRVDVLLVSWGQLEGNWTKAGMRAVNDQLQAAAREGMTIVVASGNGESQARKDADPADAHFPASSPWVLAVGGTSLKRSAGKVKSETAWKGTDGHAKAGAVSGMFEQPDWQSGLATLRRPDGTPGRNVPDVVATAWDTMANVRIDGKLVSIGGTSVSAAIWAALVAIVNQGLGRNVGFINPELYSSIGPAGALRVVSETETDKNAKGAPAAVGWNAAAGWGSPDGERLLACLRKQAAAAPPASP